MLEVSNSDKRKEQHSKLSEKYQFKTIKDPLTASKHSTNT
jgi:hypothetical protein